jgi:hypothetical protein
VRALQMLYLNRSLELFNVLFELLFSLLFVVQLVRDAVNLVLEVELLLFAFLKEKVEFKYTFLGFIIFIDCLKI